MCVGAILQSRIDRLVYGAPNTLCGAAGSWVSLIPSSTSNSSNGSAQARPQSRDRHDDASAVVSEPDSGWESDSAASEAEDEPGTSRATFSQTFSAAASHSWASVDTDGDVHHTSSRSSNSSNGTVHHTGQQQTASSVQWTPAFRTARMQSTHGEAADNGAEQSPERTPSAVGEGPWRDAPASELPSQHSALDDPLTTAQRRALSFHSHRSGLDGEQDPTTVPRHPFHVNLQVSKGVLEAECTALMQQFFQQRRHAIKQGEQIRGAWSQLSLPAR